MHFYWFFIHIHLYFVHTLYFLFYTFCCMYKFLSVQYHKSVSSKFNIRLLLLHLITDQNSTLTNLKLIWFLSQCMPEQRLCMVSCRGSLPYQSGLSTSLSQRMRMNVCPSVCPTLFVRPFCTCNGAGSRLLLVAGSACDAQQIPVAQRLLHLHQHRPNTRCPHTHTHTLRSRLRIRNARIEIAF